MPVYVALFTVIVAQTAVGSEELYATAGGARGLRGDASPATRA